MSLFGRPLTLHGLAMLECPLQRTFHSPLFYASCRSHSGINPSRKLTTSPGRTVHRKCQCLHSGPEVTGEDSARRRPPVMPSAKRWVRTLSSPSLPAILHLPFCLLSWPYPASSQVIRDSATSTWAKAASATQRRTRLRMAQKTTVPTSGTAGAQRRARRT